MKLRILALLTIFTNIVFSQSYHDTQGKLEISNNGQATFNLPIAIPSSINNYGPKIDINYVSGQGSGIAGQGWSINGISKITRINTRFDIDGFIDGVDFDENDKLALDGQRLITKTATYWSDGAIYQTEFQSNTKIQQFGTGTSIYFLVSLPDGSKNWYGNFNGNNATDITSYYIVRSEDTDGNFIVYNYFKPFNESLCLQNIQFSANLNSNLTPLNQIDFLYKTSNRTETAYLNGTKIVKKEMLDRITVSTNTLQFKKYQFTYDINPEGYDKLIKFQEFNSNNEGANPIEFEYKEMTGGVDASYSYRKWFFLPEDKINIVGDFNGDNLLDFVAGSKVCLNRESPNFYYASHYNMGSGKILQARVKYNNKLVQNSALVVADEGISDIKIKVNFFKRINSTTTDEQYSYEKTISYDNTINCVDYCANGTGNCEEIDEFGNVVIVPCNTDDCAGGPSKKITNQYIEGDFNGDGLSEILLLGFNDIMRFAPMSENSGRIVDPEDPCVWVHDVSKYPMKINLIDLDQNASTIENSSGNIVLSNLDTVMFGSGKRYVLDYNGDGKSDIICFNEGSSGFYRVLGFKQLNVTPWVELEIIAQGFIDKYEEYKQILFGDYNGDGKTDFMLPEGECNNIGDPACSAWYIYYANPNPSFVNSFVKEYHLAAPYNPLKVYPSTGQTFVNIYLPMDINKDGKTDLVRVENWTNNNGDFWTGYTLQTFTQIFVYVNNIGNSNLGNSFSNLYNSESMQMSADASNYPMIANHRTSGLETDLLLFTKWNTDQGFYGQNGVVRSVFFNRNNKKNNLIKKIFQSEGKIVDEIFYSNMIGSNTNYYCGIGTDFYSSDNSLQYPLVEIKGIFSDELVSKVTNTVGTFKRNKEYKFEGLAIDFKGLGFLGYKKSAQTSWYLDADTKKTWSVIENDPLKRGAISRNYSLFLTDPLNFDLSYTNLISEVNYEYETSLTGILPYYVLAKKQISKDYLTNVISEKENVSYSSDYFLPLIVKNKKYLGTNLQGVTTTTTTFDNPIDTSISYIIGRPKEVYSISEIFVNTSGSYNSKFSNEKLDYLNNRLSRTEKTSNGSAEKIVEEFNYFANGLLQSKTIKAENTTSNNAVNSRTTEYTYDPSNRFVKTTKAPDGLITTYDEYDPIYGLVKKETNSYGQTTNSIYDFWGKRTKVTDFLGNSITYNYGKTNGIYKTTQVGDDGSSSIIEQDVLSREVKRGKKDLNGNWNYVTSEYDQYGRKYRVSEPYNGTSSPTQWTTSEFDDYSRPIKVTAHTGKIVSTYYGGLSVTATEPTMTKNKTMNALGLVISSTDTPGGTITYKYDATGNMLESDYDGIKMTLTYDNWGRKQSLVDTSVGTYSYSYDAFGQVKTEITPKGSTVYTYDDFGKMLTKSIQGNTTADFTNIVSTYSYDPTNKWLTNIAVVNPNDGNNNYAYTYDTTTKQLKKTIETLFPVGSMTPIATFTKELTFDLFGRVDTETSTASAFSKSSTKTMKHTYKNGVLWQLLDGATVKWQANTANARGQLTSLTLGNGININNTYDNLGYLTQNKHDINATNVMTLNTVFEPILGNLTSRYNSLFDTKEEFKYDNLDRLISWDGGTQNILNLPFNTTTDGFTFTSTSTYGSVTNSVGTLKVVLKATDPDFPIAAQKSLTLGLTNGDKISVKATITNKTGTGGVIVNAVMVETDPADSSNYIEYVIGTIQNGNFETNYTVSNFVPNPLLKLRFVIDEASPESSNGGGIVPPNTTFYVDNFKIDEVVVYAQNYDDRGRITQNNLGTYSYDVASNHPYQNKKINLNTEANTYYASRPTQDISYNAFKAPIQIEQSSVDKISFAYNGMEERSIMYWGNTNSDKLIRPYRRYYSVDGSMEIKATFGAGSTTVPTGVEFLTYLDGDAYGASVVLKSDGTTQNYFYLHRDYQGSVLAITNATGVVIEKRLFDAWGAIVKVQDGVGNNLAKLTFFDRGYTGHEHLESVGLIHMNARLYDPKLHRFLQADNYIQDTNNTQNYNRYGYCFNNPLKYTDPSGNFIQIGVAIAIGVAVALATHIIQAVNNNQPLTFGGIMTTTVIAAFSSAASFGVGEGVTGNIGNFYLCASVQAVAHGTLQGGLTYMQGGKFWSGFAAGSISSIVSSAWRGGISSKTTGNITTERVIDGLGGEFANSGVGTIFFGTISGGAGSALTGGNFWQGAVTGLIVSGLNHVIHGSPNPKTGLSSRRYATNDNGDIISESLNYFNPDKAEDVDLYNRAESEPLRMNELTIYSHANQDGFAYHYDLNFNNSITNVLKTDSVMFRNFINGKTKNLTMVLKACGTGDMRLQGGRNISAILSKTPGLTVFGAAGYWFPNGISGMHDGGKLINYGYNKFQNGKYLYNVSNK